MDRICTDVVQLIFERLGPLEFVRFAATCRRMRTCARRTTLVNMLARYKAAYAAVFDNGVAIASIHNPPRWFVCEAIRKTPMTIAIVAQTTELCQLAYACDKNTIVKMNPHMRRKLSGC